MQFSPVKECALAHNIPVMQPVNVSVPEVIDELRAYEPELIVSCCIWPVCYKEDS